ncbi:phage portal protein [Bacillus swezeyi]|uniref:Phage portal protein n=1 Tax=Bacillus swezeyi TaxID=1925020 RepID=A0A1R1RQ89_9BACI|nr:phage portal protein [Bacillus swezeyi]MEC1262508.1 phage portal protein [Bacillus swezeyi]MED2926783.1 phage portal protein [Bacillus swezeyi]MED2943439.1 phage portal protein [Bacillus swezeyi]MED2965655.1 phage portal protein [Bacillus swezeyi]MED2978345.1 phage portal protein [Bacillus swezeyi]
MNDETGSVMNFFYQIFPAVCYEKEIPDHFQIPSLYFPPPSVFDENDTVSTFKKVFSLNVKLFHHDSQKAHDHAERIADAVRQVRHAIPLVDQSGADTGESLRISRIETRIGDAGTASIIVQWNSRYWYKREAQPSLETIDFTNGVK